MQYDPNAFWCSSCKRDHSGECASTVATCVCGGNGVTQQTMPDGNALAKPCWCCGGSGNCRLDCHNAPQAAPMPGGCGQCAGRGIRILRRAIDGKTIAIPCVSCGGVGR